MHTATENFDTGSFTGGLTHWVAGMWNKLASGGATPVASYPILQDVEFSHALVGLAAKLTAVDGNPTAAEYAAFCSLFPMADTNPAKLRSLFVKAMNDPAPAMQYARAIKTLHPEATALHREVLDRLLKVAGADATLNAAEHELLRAVAKVFDISSEEWRALMAQHLRPSGANAYTILGATKKMTDAQLREKYMTQVRLLHPDRYQAAGASDDTIAMLSDKLAVINAAYDSIMRAREMKKR